MSSNYPMGVSGAHPYFNQPDEFFCPVCERDVEPEWDFCPYCGANLEKGWLERRESEAEEAAANARRTPPRRGRERR